MLMNDKNFYLLNKSNQKIIQIFNIYKNLYLLNIQSKEAIVS